MNCCGGTDHEHGGSGQKDNGHATGEAGLNWTRIGAVMLMALFLAGLLFTFLK
ncbi:MAG TPA: hypothetical protein HA254_04985 [Candidatus Diapherotrites archaeon]|uniref:Uncharacterized protein n=1 Tax=Candidatus Iainarchaeum sp. TaxID=3101447 RepID=A0A7J4IYR1_9ARCH|nr:hypothetical protein [Candidatus Diapherotrites archaeon]